MIITDKRVGFKPKGQYVERIVKKPALSFMNISDKVDVIHVLPTTYKTTVPPVRVGMPFRTAKNVSFVETAPKRRFKPVVIQNLMCVLTRRGLVCGDRSKALWRNYFCR